MATTKTTRKRLSRALTLCRELERTLGTIRNDPDSEWRGWQADVARDQAAALREDIREITKRQKK